MIGASRYILRRPSRRSALTMHCNALQCLAALHRLTSPLAQGCKLRCCLILCTPRWLTTEPAGPLSVAPCAAPLPEVGASQEALGKEQALGKDQYAQPPTIYGDGSLVHDRCSCHRAQIGTTRKIQGEMLCDGACVQSASHEPPGEGVGDNGRVAAWRQHRAGER